MNWETLIFSILGSGVATAIVNGLMNNRAQIRAIKESGLYAKRAKVLDELMEKMERLDRLVRELVSPFQYEASDEAENTRRKKAIESFESFIGFYMRNRHYLPKKLSDDIEKLCGEYRELFTKFIYQARIQGENPDVKLWSELNSKIQKDFVVKKESVAEEFRKIIGVK